MLHSFGRGGLEDATIANDPKYDMYMIRSCQRG